MKYEYRITRITPNNNTKSEEILNEFGKEGFRVAAWAPFNLDVVLVLEREVTAKRQVTVEAPKE